MHSVLGIIDTQVEGWVFTFHLSARGSLDTGFVPGWRQDLGPGPDLLKICRCLEVGGGQ